MSIETMKQALEALEINLVFLRNVKPFKGQEDLAFDCIAMTEETIKSLRQAIAKAEAEQQEPEAWMHVRGDFKFPSRFLVEQNDVDAGWTGYALYTTPQPRKQLTDEQIDAYLESEWTGYSSYYDCFKEIVRWAEAKHDIKE